MYTSIESRFDEFKFVESGFVETGLTLSSNKPGNDKQMIDIGFDFTTDSPGYWEGFWERNAGLGSGGSDPDNASPTLQEYHRLLWSRQLPNGEHMRLNAGNGSDYLTWKDFRFGSDSIIVSFRYKKYSYMIDQVKDTIRDYKKYYENLIRRAYAAYNCRLYR